MTDLMFTSKDILDSFNEKDIMAAANNALHSMFKEKSLISNFNVENYSKSDINMLKSKLEGLGFKVLLKQDTEYSDLYSSILIAVPTK